MADYDAYVITSDLSELPIVLGHVTCDAALFELLAMYKVDGPNVEGLCEDSKATLVNMRENARAPNDGLLGTTYTEQFTLPELGGMRIHLQLDC
jgi:hypothetical protein